MAQPETTLAEILDRIEQHAHEIYERDIKNGEWGSYRLTELSVEQALAHVCRWIRDAARMPESRCLVCGYNLDFAAGVGHEDRPRPGSLIICFRCRAVMKMGDDLKPRTITEEEAAQVRADPELMEFLDLVTQNIRTRPKMD